jgi:hypothetical protein
MLKSRIFLILVSAVVVLWNASAAVEPHTLVIKLVDTTGAVISDGTVTAILKSGAYQDAKFENGFYRCKPTSQCIKIFAGASGHLATVRPHSGSADVVTVTMSPSTTRHSTIVHGRGPLPGIDGEINPIYDPNPSRLCIYGMKIGLEKGGKIGAQPMPFSLNRRIDAVSTTGNKFGIWIVDIEREISLVEYTLPKGPKA